MLTLLLAALTLYLGDENAALAGKGKADSTVLSFAGATTDDLIAKLDEGILKDVEADTVDLFIGANNTKIRSYAEETPLDTVLDAKDITVRLRKRYPKAVIALNPLAYIETDSLENRLRNYEVNRAYVYLHEGGGKMIFMRQPDWMYKCPAPSKWKPSGSASSACIKKYWLDNLKDPRLKKKREEQRTRNIKEWDCVMLGDSITHFWEKINGKAYFDRNLGSKWKIFNLGFGGDSTQNTIWNLLNSGYTDGVKVKLFTVLIGTNNIHLKSTDDDIAKTADACGVILDIIRERHPESKIVLFPLLPKTDAKHPGVFQKLHRQYNAIIGKYADGKSVIWAGELWDRYWATADAQGNLPKTMLCDGCHPGTEGYCVWGEILKTYLKRYCKR